MIFCVFNDDEENVKFQLDDFHKELDNPFNADERLLLTGAVAYIGPSGRKVNTRNSDEGTARELKISGHYVCYSYRRGNTSWMEADDQIRVTTAKKGNHKIVPRLLIYVKKN